MTYCLNSACSKPQNSDSGKFCINCGSRLRLGDRFRAIKLISQGGFGRTFLGVDEGNKIQAECVIKQVLLVYQGTKNSQEAEAKFRTTCQQLQKVGQHPQIPSLLGYFEGNNLMSSTVVQELISGASLQEDLLKQGAWGEEKVKELLDEFLPILQFIHDQGVIHRDLNPNNIIYVSNPHKKRAKVEITAVQQEERKLFIVDFSAAKVTTKTALAKQGTVIGSASYTAPEQLMGQAIYASDIYSLGVICIYLLTQIDPFDLFSRYEAKWVWQDYLLNPVSDKLAAVINKMLAEKAQERYQSATEVFQDLNSGQTITLFPKQKQTLPKSTLSTLAPTWHCLATLEGHSSSIHDLSFSLDGKYLASCGADRKVKMWDLSSKKLTQDFLGHKSLIEAVTFSPEGKIIISGSWDSQIKVWQVETGEEIANLTGHTGWIKTLAISNDGGTLVSGSADKTIKLWDLTTNELKHTFPTQEDTIQSLQISSDGHNLVSGSSDGTVKFWDLQTYQLKQEIKAHSQEVTSLAFTPSNKIMISSSGDGTIKFWQLENGNSIKTITSNSTSINDLAINREGNLLVSGNQDNTVKIYHPSSGSLLHELTGHDSGVLGVTISIDSKIIASASRDKTVKLWQYS